MLNFHKSLKLSITCTRFYSWTMKFRQGRWDTGILFVVICIFSLSSWVDINGLCTEIPLLVGLLPEGWNLPSYLAVAVQTANLAPFVYLLLKKLRPNWVKEWLAACVIIVVGMTASLLLAFTWDKTSYVGGRLHSTALLVLSFFLALVDCTSSVVYLTYMAEFKSQVAMTALYVGEGLSGVIPALIGLLQVSEVAPTAGSVVFDQAASVNSSTIGNGTLISQPTLRFSISTFFIILSLILLVSLVSFCFVNFHSYFDRFKVKQRYSKTPSKAISNLSQTENELPSLLSLSTTIRHAKDTETDDSGKYGEKTKDMHRIVILCIIVVLISSLNYGLIPSIQSYACLPYGYLTYDLSVKLSILANPLSCFLTLLLMPRRLSIISIITLLGTVMSAYQIYLAVVSSNPILTEGRAGTVLAIISSVVISSCFAYAKVCISATLAELGGEKLLLYCGFFTRVGCLVGAVTGFLLVNLYLEKN